MRVFFSLLLLCVAGVLLTACDFGTNNGNNIKIAVADVSKLMGESVPGKAGIKFLEGRRAQFQKDLDELQEKIKKNPSDDAVMNELQKALAVSQQQLQAEGQNVANLLFDTLQRVLDKFREAGGYAVILSQDMVASFSRTVDVTDLVMKELDKEVIEFKALAAPSPVGIEIPPSKEETPASTENAASGDSAQGEKAQDKK